MMGKRKTQRQFVVCIDNKDHPASLELRKVYQVIPDEAGGSHGLIRVIDESGEDYLYPSRLFVSINLPDKAISAFAEAL